MNSTGRELSRQLSQELPKAALQRALRSATPEMHHSDQGVQYAADGYTEILRAAGVQISMSAQGQPAENAYANASCARSRRRKSASTSTRIFADARTHPAEPHSCQTWTVRPLTLNPLQQIVLGSSATCSAEATEVGNEATELS